MAMNAKNCLVLTQYRKGGTYNDFIGKFYHFPGGGKKNYLSFFKRLPIDFVYYEPEKDGRGEFFGYGKISKPPFLDKREKGNYFVEIADFKPFSKPVYFKSKGGKILEQQYSPKLYNAQNAVRGTTPKFIEEVCLDGGVTLSFKADAHLIRVLGEQLIASERVGVLELVKNSYDAGASFCRVRIEKVPGLPEIEDSLCDFSENDGPVIVIEDDGRGMTWREIENGWLRPASTIKTNVKERLKAERLAATEKGTLKTFDRFIKALKIEYGGRIPLGEKGVGRFATHRLGKNLTIKTKVKELDYEYVLNINWDEFDVVSDEIVDLDSIGVHLTRQSPSREYGDNGSGTQIVIFGGRKEFELTREEIIEINRTLNKLNTPNPKPDSQKQKFAVVFECPQIPTLDDKSVADKFDPIFTILGIVDDEGVFEYDFSFTPPTSVPMPKEIRQNRKADLRAYSDEKKFWALRGDEKQLRKPSCGPFYIHLNVWYRRAPWIDGPFGDDFKQYLDNYGGISVYRDGINVFPAEWGAETDWLQLSKRHIKKGGNISYYDMLGNVEIEQTINFDLIDKTNREGVLQNNAYQDLRKLVRGVVLLLENDVKGKRDDYNSLTGNLVREPKQIADVARVASNILENLDEKYDVPNDPLEILEKLGKKHERKTNLVNVSRSLKNLEKSLDVIKENQDLMTEHAGFGIGIAVVIHEIAKTTANFYHGIADLLKLRRWDESKLEHLKDASASLQAEIKRISPLRAIKNEDPVVFRVSKSLRFCKEVLRPPLEKEGIDFTFNSNQDFEIKARYSALNQILVNLLDNSIYWLARTTKEQRRIRIEIDQEKRTLIVADSGDGIHESILPHLFKPGYSLRFPPSGLGLYICKYYMNDMKGEVYLTNERDKIPDLSGAQFTLDFSRVKDK